MNKIVCLISSVNNGDLLEDCIKSALFCDEIIIINQESNDNTVDIAKKYGATIINHKRVKYQEQAHYNIIPKIKTNYVLLLDPDERIDSSLKFQIIDTISSDISDLGVLFVPWRFYFAKKRLKGTIWGYNNTKRLVLRVDAVILNDVSHDGYSLKEGYKKYDIPLMENNVLHHLWMNNLGDLGSFISKHKRYLETEGINSYTLGNRFNWYLFLLTPGKEFVKSFIFKRGYKDYLIGFALSVFWSWYQTVKLWKLRKHEIKLKKLI